MPVLDPLPCLRSGKQGDAGSKSGGRLPARFVQANHLPGPAVDCPDSARIILRRLAAASRAHLTCCFFRLTGLFPAPFRIRGWDANSQRICPLRGVRPPGRSWPNVKTLFLTCVLTRRRCLVHRGRNSPGALDLCLNSGFRGGPSRAKAGPLAGAEKASIGCRRGETPQPPFVNVTIRREYPARPGGHNRTSTADPREPARWNPGYNRGLLMAPPGSFTNTPTS
jgi:hypothetical protein